MGVAVFAAPTLMGTSGGGIMLHPNAKECSQWRKSEKEELLRPRSGQRIWAYDIGYGGLDLVLALGKNIKILVMDTEV